MYTLSDFYKSKEWMLLRLSVMNDRLDEKGQLICEHCGGVIVRQYECIAHHKNYLTEANVNDAMISLNPDNIALVHHRCHNIIHEKLCRVERQVFLVYGPPLSGKTTFVRDNMNAGDLVVDMDNIWQCISGLGRYEKPGRLNTCAFCLKDCMLDMVKYRTGKWVNAYVIGGYPLISERERLCKTLGAREIFVDCSREECLMRLEAESRVGGGRNVSEWTKFINEWFDRYSPPL